MSVIVERLSVKLGERQVLSNISVTFPAHTFTVLTGPSGTGKTTLLGAIGGVVMPDSGNIRIHGEAPSPQMSAWVPQGANSLPNRTLIDNVMIAPLSNGCDREHAYHMAQHYLARVGLSDREHSVARELSGGELQRLSLARALSSNQPVLLADEPTANLDHLTALSIIALLQAAPKDRVIVVATHDPELIAAAELVVDLRELQAKALQEQL